MFPRLYWSLLVLYQYFFLFLKSFIHSKRKEVFLLFQQILEHFHALFRLDKNNWFFLLLWLYDRSLWISVSKFTPREYFANYKSWFLRVFFAAVEMLGNFCSVWPEPFKRRNCWQLLEFLFNRAILLRIRIPTFVYFLIHLTHQHLRKFFWSFRAGQEGRPPKFQSWGHDLFGVIKLILNYEVCLFGWFVDIWDMLLFFLCLETFLVKLEQQLRRFIARA